MNLSSINFAQPLWLLGIFIIPLVMILKKYFLRVHLPQNLTKSIDKDLLPHILVSAGSLHKNAGGWIYALMTLLIFVALANPRWDYTELNAYQPSASVVVLFDLSDPEYVVAARQQIEDLLNNAKGLKIGLIAYAGMPHLVAPITDDLQTLINFLPALDNDLITKHGNNVHLAINMGIDLLDAEPGNNKSIVLVSGSDISKNNLVDAARPKKSSYHFYILGLGTRNISSLQNIAKITKGSYITADHSERAVNAIVKKIHLQNEDNAEVSGKIIQWSDNYYWFLLPVMFLFLYVFRFGALLVVVAFIMVPEADALEWFSNDNQQGMQAYKKTEFIEAAGKFTDNYNKAVALYRAGEYAAAESLFRSADSIASIYNMGNAQMQQQKWQQAVDSYERVLAEDPSNQDAKFNLEIAKKKLMEQEENKKQEQEQKQEKEEKDNKKQNKSENTSQQGEQKQYNDTVDEESSRDQEASESKQPESKQPESKQEDKTEEHPSDENEELQNHTNPKDQSEKEETQSSEEISQGVPEYQGEIDNADLWLNRIDSDIKFLLKNKFYIEGILHEQ